MNSILNNELKENNKEKNIEENEEARYANILREEFIEECEDNGLVILYPKENELFIDCDTEEHFRIFEEQLAILNRNLCRPDWGQLETWESKGGFPGKHIVLTLPFSVSDIERIAYQAVLGSDPKREILSLIRLKKGDVAPTLFVERKGFVRKK